MKPMAAEPAPANLEIDTVVSGGSRSCQKTSRHSSAQLTPNSGRLRFKTVLWISLGLTALFVFITSEVLLVADYPMYHAYRLQVIADRYLLIPHVLAGTF